VWWLRCRNSNKIFLDGTSKSSPKLGFTLAEVLITLGIIGVVAAMTIPTLMTAYQKHMVETRLKYVYATILQGFRMRQAQYGDFSLTDLTVEGQDVNGYSYDKSKAVFDEIFAPVFVGSTSIPKEQRYYAYSLKGKKFPNDNYAAWYSLANGTVLGFIRMGNYDGAGFVVVLNPQKQRPISGKDYFYFVFQPDDFGTYRYKTLASANYSEDKKNQFIEYCKSETNYPAHATSPMDFCTTLIVKNNFKIPAGYPIKF
jgi:prepilin-type N-terminal cleavage/methylation domain-containing protein